MALMKKQDKDQNGKKPAVPKDAAKDAAKDGAKKPAPKVDKKPVPVKKEKVNRIEQARKYFRGVYGELKKVHWPTRREVLVYTSVVVVAVIIVAILIWVFDSLMGEVIKLFVR